MAQPRATALESTSRPSSILTTTTENTDVTLTNRASQETLREIHTPPHNHTRQIENTYNGYPSKEAYLQALLEFAQSRQYYETDTQLIGFYGTKTMDDYLRAEGGWRSKSKQQKKEESERKAEKKAEKERRKSEAESGRSSAVGTEGDSSEQVEGKVKGVRRFSKGFGTVFIRRGTVA